MSHQPIVVQIQGDNSQLLQALAQAQAGVLQSVGRIESTLGKLDVTASRTGAGAGDALADSLDNVSRHADAAADKIDGTTRGIINAVQRQIAAMEAGDRQSAEFFRTLGQSRGANMDVLTPHLEQLDTLASRQRNVARSSGEMDAAMRNLPAQFTDIFTSLASGQDPMLVFLQQGGQIKDMFGGTGPALRAMGQYLLDLVNPYTVAAAAAATLVVAHEIGAREARAFNEALASTNNASGITADALADMAARMDEVNGTQALAAQTLAALASTGAVAASNMEYFGTVVVAHSRAGGAAVDDLAKNFADLAKDPVEAVLRLDKEMRFLTATVYEQIDSLAEQGRATEAAEVAQHAYADALAKRTAEMSGNLGTLQRWWIAIKDAAKEAGDALLNVGRQQTVAQQIAEKKLRIAELSAQTHNLTKAWIPQELKTLRAEVDALESDARRLATDASRDAEREKTRKAGLVAVQDLDKLLDSAASRAEKLDKEMSGVRRKIEDAAKAGRAYSEKEQEAMFAAVRKKYAPPKARQGSTSLGQTDSELAALKAQIENQRQLSDALAQYGKEADKLTPGQKLLNKLLQEQAVAKKDAVKQHIAAKVVLAQELVQIELRNRATQDGIKQAEEERKLDEQRTAAFEAHELALRGQISDLARQRDEYGLTAAQIADNTARTWELSVAEAEKNGGTAEGIEYLRQQAAIYRELATAQQGLQDKKDADEREKSVAEAARRAADEWQRASDQISDALTDALMKGFDDGKSFAENFADTLENTFKTMVLRPMVQAIVQPVGNAIGQAFGGQMGATGQSGADGSSSMFSGGSFGASSAASMGNMIGQFGNWTGSASTAAYGTGMTLSAKQAADAAAAFTEAGMGDIASQLQAGQQAASTVGTVATAAGYVMAAYNGIKAVEQGRWGTAVGTAIGAFTPLGPLGAAIGGQIGGMVDDMFGGGGGAKTGGEGWTGSQRDEFYTPGESDRQLRDTVRQLQAQYIGMAVSLGGSAKGLQFGLGFDSDPNGSAGDRVKSALYGANGQAVYSVLDRGVESAQDGVKAEANRLLVAALQQSDLPANLAKVLSGIDVATASEESLQSALDRVQAIGRIEASFKQLALVFPQLNGLSLEAKERLAELSGGVGALESNLGAFYSNFVPEEEKRAQVLAEIEKELAKVNVRLPTSRQQFREVAEELQASGQTGSEAFAKMMSLAGAFASVTDAAVESAANRRQSALADLQSAYDRESDALRSSIDRLDQFVRGLRDFRQQLQLGDLSILSPEQKYLEAQRDWQATLAAAQGGDEDARDKLTSVAQAYLEASRAYNASSEQYSRDYATVQAALVTLESSGRAAASMARQQLEVLNRQVDGLLEINKSVLSVRDAIAALQSLAKPAASPTVGAGAGTSGGLPVYSGAGSAPAGTVSPQQAVADLYQQILGREADVGGLVAYSSWVMQGKSLQEVADSLRNSDEFKRINGSHATGLGRVPFDGYVAELHRDEGVLTAQQNRAFQSIDWSRFGAADNAPLLAEISALRAEVASLRRENREDATAQRQQQAVIAGETLKQGSQLAGQLKTAAASAF